MDYIRCGPRKLIEEQDEISEEEKNFALYVPSRTLRALGILCIMKQIKERKKKRPSGKWLMKEGMKPIMNENKSRIE